MNTLREALPEYLHLRRSLGFKLDDAGLLLPRFVAFLEEHGTAHITTALSLAWAQQSASVQPAEWARRLCCVRGFARYRSATDALTQVPPLGSCRTGRPGPGRICTRTRKFERLLDAQ
jgi:hypothetical protein